MRGPWRRFWCAPCALVLGIAALAAPAGPGAGLPDSEAGHCAYAYLEVFNTGDDAAVKGYFESCFSPQALAQRPMEQRVALTRQFRTEAGMLELRKVVESGPERLVLLVHSQQGEWLELTFMIDPGSGKFRGIMIQTSEPPDSAEAAPKSWEELPKALDAYLKKAADAGEFSGVVLVARGGATVFHEAYGLANRPFQAPARKDTKFNLGSINKVFTKVAVARLAERGKLSLDDTVGKLLPDYPNQDVAAKVTVRQLLNFTSGMGDFFGERFDATPKDRLRDNRDFLPLFAPDPLLFEPGRSQQYSNAGYVVLGMIVEKRSGKSYYDAVREAVYSPAGMKDTDSYMADAPTPNLAEGYTAQWDGKEHPGEPLRANVYSRPARGSAAGGGYSTAEDLLRFADALRAGKLLTKPYSEWVLGGPEPGASAENSPPPPGWPMAAFAGGAPGINAQVALEGEVTVVVLANLDPPAAGRVAQKVTRWARGLPK